MHRNTQVVTQQHANCNATQARGHRSRLCATQESDAAKRNFWRNNTKIATQPKLEFNHAETPQHAETLNVAENHRAEHNNTLPWRNVSRKARIRLCATHVVQRNTQVATQQCAICVATTHTLQRNHTQVATQQHANCNATTRKLQRNTHGATEHDTHSRQHAF